MITPIRIRKIAPIRIAIADVSPMVPAVRPISISIVLTASPLRMAASGVTLEYTSIPFFVMPNFVISAANAIKRKHLALSAGFMKFCPSPPNRHFTTTIANTPPITASHHGRVAGRFNASSSPVTTALRSSIVCFLCTILLNTHSDATQLAIVTRIRTNALYPKL